MELDNQINNLKKTYKAVVASFFLMIPLIFFDAWILQIVWNKWLWGLTGVYLTYIGYVGVMMFAKVICSIFKTANNNSEALRTKDVIIESIGKRLAILIMLGLFSLIWMVLI